MEIVVNSVITIISVLIGGLLTFIIGQRDIKRNTKLEVYLEFLKVADGRYDNEKTSEYLDVLRKIYLVGNKRVIDALILGGYLPVGEKSNFLERKDPIENPLKVIVHAMRKDVGNHNKSIKKYNMQNLYFKSN